MSYDSPAVLNMLNDASSGMGGVGMGITMSGLGMSSLGLSASAMGRADEAERTRRLQAIIDIVGAKPGRVSEEGLLALCKRLGIPYEKEQDAVGTWLLLIGDEAVCEVAFKNDEIVKVNLQTRLDEERPELQFGATGSQILIQSLKPHHGQSKINLSLGPVSESLQKLLTLAQLGAPQSGGVSCYNAIAGVYTSLRKLFEHQKKANLATRDATDRYRNYKAEREVLCKKSGRPRLNGGSCLGLSLEYWMHRRHLMPRTGRPTLEKGKQKMHATFQESSTCPEDDEPEKYELFSLTIECESSPSTLYTPIRISNEWISDNIEKPVDADDTNAAIDSILQNPPAIDWLDPKPTYLDGPTTTAEAIDLDSAPGRLPNIRFVAKFNPPLVVPLTVYMQVYQMVGIEPRTEEFQATTFVGLALRPGEMDPGMTNTTGGSTYEIRSTQSVLYLNQEGKEAERRHELSLYLPKMEFSRTLESLPFSHPKQLVEILPVLRQYAATTALLKNSFLEKGEKPTQIHSQGDLPSPPLTPAKDSKDGVETLQVDVNLSYTPPIPRFTLSIPHPSSTLSTKDSTNGSTADSVSDLLADLLSGTSTFYPPIGVTIDVHANGELVVAEQNLMAAPTLQSTADGKDGDIDMEQAERADQQVKRLGKALDICGDVSIWGEWLRREVTNTQNGDQD